MAQVKQHRVKGGISTSTEVSRTTFALRNIACNHIATYVVAMPYHIHAIHAPLQYYTG